MSEPNLHRQFLGSITFFTYFCNRKSIKTINKMTIATEKKKRHQWLLVLTLLLVGGAFTSVHAKSNWTSGQCTVTLSDDGTLKVSKASGNGRMADYDANGGLGDTAPWYDWSPDINYVHKIKNIIVEEGVSYVGAYAFADCEGVASVTLPESLTEIAHHAFTGCSMSQITIPANVSSIGEDAFYGCEFLYQVYMYADPASLTWTDNENPDFSYYGTACHVRGADRDAFESKFHIPRVTFWGDLDQIDGPWNSGDCVVELSIDGTLTVRKNGGEGRMADSYGHTPWTTYAADIREIVIAEGVTYIGMNAFQGCKYATTVSLPSTLTTIGGAAFEGCSGLQSVTLPEGLTTINYYAFRGCTGLTTITFPASVTYIDAFSFLDCTSMTDVYSYPDPRNLEWWAGTNADDFKPGKATKCHVWAGYQTYYQQTFDRMNVTWVGDLDLPGQNMGVAINATNFPDENFRQAVHDLSANNGDDYLSDVELSLVTSMNVAFKEITDLTGIGYFTALEQLECSGNNLNTLSLSQNTNLSSLYCWNAHLTSLDVSQNTNLLILSCYMNELKTLDLSQNIKLVALDCSRNQLTTLDLSHNTSLRSLDCYYNQIKGSGLSALLESLPDCGGSLQSYVRNDSNEGNDETTRDQRNALRSKGWSAFYRQNNEWLFYDNIAYNVWVGATRVTETNMDDVLGDGTVSYEPETSTLTFASGKAVIEGVYDAYKIFSRDIDLTIDAPEGLLVENPTGYGIHVGNGERSLTINGDITFNTQRLPVDGCLNLTVNGNVNVTTMAAPLTGGDVTINGNVKGSGSFVILAAGDNLVLNGTKHEFNCTSSNPCLRAKNISIAGDLTAKSNNTMAIIAQNDITLVSGSWTIEGSSSLAIGAQGGNINIPETHTIITPAHGHLGKESGYTTILNNNDRSVGRIVIVDSSNLLCLYDDTDNSAELSKYDGTTTKACVGRRLIRNGWNTLVLPFNITDLKGVFGRDVRVKELTGSSITNGVLKLTFGNASRIEAGKPYLVRVANTMELNDQIFEDVNISNSLVPTVTEVVDFIPVMSKTTLVGDRKSVLFIDMKYLTYPSELPDDMKGLRAYFKVKTPDAVRSIMTDIDDGDATLVNSERVNSEKYSDEWYTLDGRKLSKQPAAKGVYINRDKKIIVK